MGGFPHLYFPYQCLFIPSADDVFVAGAATVVVERVNGGFPHFERQFMYVYLPV